MALRNDDSPVVALMRECNVEMTREAYLNLSFFGEPPVDEDGFLHPELESELPRQFQRPELRDEFQDETSSETEKSL